jgi:hypothetical protein
MTELRVKADELDSYGKLLDRVGDQAVKAQKYFSEYSDLGGGKGLFIKVVDPASQTAVGAAKNVLAHLERAGRRSNNGLRSAAVYYRKTEHHIAAKADAVYPEAARPGARHDIAMGTAPVRTHGFKDREDPLSHLKEPEVDEVEAAKSPMDDITAVFDAIAPSTAVVNFIQMITGYNPAEQAGEWFGGDWKSYAECGGALENIGKMMNSASTNIQEGANELGDTWQGNAGDAAQGFFTDLSTAVGRQETVFSGVGEEYKKAASGVARLAETGAGLYKGMIDHAIIGAVAMAAGAASSETVIGGAAGGITAAVEAALVYEDYEKFSKIRELGTAICNTFVGAVNGKVGETSLFTRFPMPSTGYEHPVDS